MSARRARLLAGLAVLAALLAAPGAARADEARRPLTPLSTETLVAPIAPPILHDPVLTGRSARRSARRLASRAPGRWYRTRNGRGTRIYVVVSGSYRATRASVQTYVNFLGTRLHGRELGRLRVGIETPAEIRRDCSPDALACYLTPAQVMLIPGEEAQGRGTVAYAVTHEYGHHVAYNRRNPPFPTILFGPKRWASLERVCPGWVLGKLFPGNEGSHYFSNPGEAWAEAYATYHFRALGWRFTPLLQPGARALRAVRTDVRLPWRRRRGRSITLRFGPGRPRVRSLMLPAPLDGFAAIRVARRTRGLRLVTRVYTTAGKRLAPARRRPLRQMPICGNRRVQLRVARHSGRGTVRLTYLRP